MKARIFLTLTCALSLFCGCGDDGRAKTAEEAFEQWRTAMLDPTLDVKDTLTALDSSKALQMLAIEKLMGREAIEGAGIAAVKGSEDDKDSQTVDEQPLPESKLDMEFERYRLRKFLREHLTSIGIHEVHEEGKHRATLVLTKPCFGAQIMTAEEGDQGWKIRPVSDISLDQTLENFDLTKTWVGSRSLPERGALEILMVTVDSDKAVNAAEKRLILSSASFSEKLDFLQSLTPLESASSQMSVGSTFSLTTGKIKAHTWEEVWSAMIPVLPSQKGTFISTTIRIRLEE